MSRLSPAYKAYIKSKKWAAKRELALKYYGRKCQVCGTRQRLEVNHLSYGTLFNESMRDLSILCHEHHMQYTRLRRRTSKQKHSGADILRMIRAAYKRG